MGKTKKCSCCAKCQDFFVKHPWFRFLLNLLFAGIIVLTLVLLAKNLLDVVTHNGEEIVVPDLSNMTQAEASVKTAELGLVIDVTDSVYIKRMRRGAIFRQYPEPGSKVKSGRTISLTINSVIPREVRMPDLVGLSLRQAKSELLSRGLTLGRYIYVQDMATNNIVRQLYRGNEVAPGTPVASETVIDLEVGQNGYNHNTFIPDVMGLKYNSAVDVIRGNSLNIDRLRFDSTVRNYEDSLNAKVYDQYPMPSDSIMVNLGSDVTLYLTLNPDKLNKQNNFEF